MSEIKKYDVDDLTPSNKFLQKREQYLKRKATTANDKRVSEAKPYIKRVVAAVNRGWVSVNFCDLNATVMCNRDVQHRIRTVMAEQGYVVRFDVRNFERWPLECNWMLAEDISGLRRWWWQRNWLAWAEMGKRLFECCVFFAAFIGICALLIAITLWFKNPSVFMEIFDIITTARNEQ